MMDTLERITDAVADGIISKADTLDTFLGERPFGKVKLPERAQVRRYSLMKKDAAYWQELIKEHGEQATVDYDMRMQRMAARYPDEELEEVG